MKLSFADVTPNRLTFNSHTSHNPTCDILELKISRDAFITYVFDLTTKEESMEYYSGENYVLDSTSKSISYHYPYSLIPKKYKIVWNALKEYYKKNYKTLQHENKQ